MAFIALPRLVNGVVFHGLGDATASELICQANGVNFLVARSVGERLAPMLNGVTPVAELIEGVRGVMSASQVLAAVQWLAKNGAIVDAAREGPWPLEIRALGGADADAQRAFEEQGFDLIDEGEAPLTVILAQHYLDETLAEQNRRATRPWMLIRPDANLWLGPIFIPGKSACWECLAQRLRFNRPVDQFMLATTGRLPGTNLEPGAVGARATLLALAAQAARRYLETGRSPLIDGLLSFDRDSLSATRHTLIRRAQCPACGTPLASKQTPPNFDVGDDWLGRRGDRDAAARHTLTAQAHHISPITGLVPELVSNSKLDGIHVFAGGPYNTRTPLKWSTLTNTIRFRGSGKGLTADAARAGALAETLEWYTLGSLDASTLETDSFERLSSRARVIPPSALAHFSKAQFANRAVINATAKLSKDRVPDPFDPAAEIEWMKAWSLTRNEWVFVPAAMVASNITSRFVRHASNGAAAGATLAEAVVHAAFELIERDAIALWWYNFLSRPAMSLDGADAKLLAAMDREYARVGRRFHVLDITSDLGVPAAAAISLGDARTEGELVMGFGAHFDPVVAATRALTEMNQLQRALVDTVPRDDRPEIKEGAVAHAPRHVEPCATAIAPPALCPLALGAERPNAQIDWLVKGLAERGLEMLVSDVTLPDVGLPVARVMIPGLRHAYRELGPGRLHDVPLREGWLSQRVTEAQMRALSLPL